MRMLRAAGAVVLGIGLTLASPAAAHAVGPILSLAAQDPAVPVVHVSKTFHPSDPHPAPGDVLVYTVVMRNDTPLPATGYRVFGTIPFGFIDKTWTCVATGPGSRCGVTSGVSNLDDVFDVGPNGGTVVYTVNGRTAPDLTDEFTQVVTVTAPPGQSCEPIFDPVNNPDLLPIVGPILPSSTPAPRPEPALELTPAPGDGNQPPYGYDQSPTPTPEQPGETPTPEPRGETPTPTPEPQPEGAICVVNNDVTPVLLQVPNGDGEPNGDLPATGSALIYLLLVGMGSALIGSSLLWWSRQRRLLPPRSANDHS